MGASDPAGARVCKLVVAPRRGAWSVTRENAEELAFAGAEDAIGFACGLARESAHAGVLGMVVVEADVKELHCFTPGQAAAALRPARRLRLVATPGSA